MLSPEVNAMAEERPKRMELRFQTNGTAFPSVRNSSSIGRELSLATELNMRGYIAASAGVPVGERGDLNRACL